MIKFWVQISGNGKRVFYAVLVSFLIIIILLTKIAFRPIELYIDDEALKRVVIDVRQELLWQSIDLKEEGKEAKAVELFD